LTFEIFEKYKVTLYISQIDVTRTWDPGFVRLRASTRAFCAKVQLKAVQLLPNRAFRKQFSPPVGRYVYFVNRQKRYVAGRPEAKDATLKFIS
jgi:hypothetical protein